MFLKRRKYTLLIVEDEISLRHALRDKFIRKGFYVLEAKDGKEGLILALKKEPDMILLDIIMPKMNGMVMLKKLRQASKWGRSVSVILLSNLGGDDEEMMAEIGKDRLADYLVKSNWSLDDVVKKVRGKLL